MTLDRYEHSVVVNALNEMRNDLLEEERPTDIVDEVLFEGDRRPSSKECVHLRGQACRNDEARE